MRPSKILLKTAVLSSVFIVGAYGSQFDCNAIGPKKTCVLFLQECPQGHQTIEYIGGKVRHIHTPGFFPVVPFFSETRDVFCGLTSADIRPENLNTKDGFSIEVDASIQYQVLDPDKAAHRIKSLHNMLKDNVEVAIRQTFCLMNLEEIIEKQSNLAQKIREHLNKQYAHLQEEVASKIEVLEKKTNSLLTQKNEEKINLLDEKNEERIQVLEANESSDNIEEKLAKLWLEDHLGIQIGNINLNRLHFPSTFSETKSKIQQATYQQLQIKVDNETKLQKQENERKLIQVASESESIKITTLANAEKEKVIIEAKAQAEELRILNEAIEKYPQAYQLKLLGISSDAWKTVGSSSSTKIIIPEGEKNCMKPLDFISQMVVTKEILDDKKLIEDKKN